MTSKGSLFLSARLRSSGINRGQGLMRLLRKRQAGLSVGGRSRTSAGLLAAGIILFVVNVHGAPWRKRQKEAWAHRIESEFGEALTLSHTAYPELSGLPLVLWEGKPRPSAGWKPAHLGAPAGGSISSQGILSKVCVSPGREG